MGEKVWFEGRSVPPLESIPAFIGLEIKTVAVLDEGCFSCLKWNGRPFAVSVERTFRPGEAAHGKQLVLGNGMFLATRDRYHKGGYDTYEIQITGHDRVLFHKGAIEDHSLACVIVGESFGGLNRLTKAYSQHADEKDQTAVLGSSAAFAELMKRAAGMRQFNVWVTGR